MRHLFALLIFLFAACTAAPHATHAPADLAQGALLAVGGGGTTKEITQRALELAGGMHARLLIIPHASERPQAGAESLAFWREQGADEVRVLDLTDPARARAEIGEADFLWLGGGDQNRLLLLLREAGVVEAIRSRWLAGALVGGTSAGAAALSAAMIVGGESADLESVRAGGTQLANGIGLWKGVIVDQHFLKRQRFNRLLAAVLDRPALVGVGIDERTAVLVHPDGSCEVLGEGGVIVLDARSSILRDVTAGSSHSASGVTLALYRKGDRFTLAPSGSGADRSRSRSTAL